MRDALELGSIIFNPFKCKFNYFWHYYYMNAETLRGYKAIQTTYAMTAAHLSQDEQGLSFLLPSTPLEVLDVLESVLVASYLTLNELSSLGTELPVLSQRLSAALAEVNSMVGENSNKPLTTYLVGLPSKRYTQALKELTNEFAQIWQLRYPADALSRAREVCAINMQFTLKA